MNNPEYKYRCTKPLCSECCTGYTDGFCVSFENCAYKQERQTNFENIKNMNINKMAKMLGDMSEQWSDDEMVEWLESEVINE